MDLDHLIAVIQFMYRVVMAQIGISALWMGSSKILLLSLGPQTNNHNYFLLYETSEKTETQKS